MSDLFQQLYNGEAAQIQRQFETQIDLDPYLIAYGVTHLFAFGFGAYLRHEYITETLRPLPPRISG